MVGFLRYDFADMLTTKMWLDFLGMFLLEFKTSSKTNLGNPTTFEGFFRKIWLDFTGAFLIELLKMECTWISQCEIYGNSDIMIKLS